MKEMKLRHMVALCAVGLALTASADDITALVRAADKATFDIEGTKIYSDSYPLSKAFDGRYWQDADRLMLKQQKPAGVFMLYYHIADDFRPGEEIRVTAFRMHRSKNDYDSYRTPSRIRLEASVTGEKDGVWVQLAENQAPFVGCGQGYKNYKPTDDELEFEVIVPIRRRGDYRHYRFVFDQSPDGETTNFQELFLDGEILNRNWAGEPLTWSGGEGGTWDATTENWQTPGGEASAWTPNVVANIGAASINVSGVQDVSSLYFYGSSILGGGLRFVYPGSFEFLNPQTVGSDISVRTEADTIGSCVFGERTTDYAFLPTNDDGKSPGKEVIWWKNRQLGSIVGFKTAMLWYYGDCNGRTDDSIYKNVLTGQKTVGAKDFKNDGRTASVWFWRYYSGSYPKIAWICAKVSFKQVGPDIAARIERIGFKWIEGYAIDEGAKIDYEKVFTDTLTPFKDDTHIPGGNTYAGLKDLIPISSTDLTITGNVVGDVVLQGKLLPDPDNKMTGQKMLFMKDTLLSQIVGFDSAKVWYVVSSSAFAQGYYFTKTDDMITVQFQRIYSGNNVLCVKVEFTQEGDDIYARAVYAKYLNNTTECGANFDEVGGAFEISTSREGYTSPSGYTASDIVPILDDLPCTFAGKFDVDRKVTAMHSRLRFGGVVTVRNAETFAATPIELIDGAKLDIAEAVAMTVPKLTVSGNVTLGLGAGATLAAAEADLSAAEKVTLPDDYDGALRIGTSAVLDRAALRKFFYKNDSYRVVQDADGYLRAEPKPGAILLVR